MIPLAKIDEQSVGTLDDLRDVLAGQRRRDCEVPLHKISLGEEGLLHAGSFEGSMSLAGLLGLLRVTRIPEGFAEHVCPPDLLVVNISRLVRQNNQAVRVHSVADVATGVMPANRLPISHDLLVNSLDLKHPIAEATLSDAFLRITSAHEAEEEVLPGDRFAGGWELINSEDGWTPMAASRFVMRLVCSSGMIGFDRTALFSRKTSSTEPVYESLDTLNKVLGDQRKPLILSPAVAWAAQRQLGDERDAVLGYLAQRLGGEAIRIALSDLTRANSFYDVFCHLTSLARMHPLTTRHRYEAEGGVLLAWFMGQGRQRAPWNGNVCEGCTVLRQDSQGEPGPRGQPLDQ